MHATDVQRIALIGVGLMGGSLGLAARKRAGVAEIYGFSQTPATLELALERGAITHACASLEEAAAAADSSLSARPCGSSSGTSSAPWPRPRRTPSSPTSAAPRGR